jgi:predicted AlkP superfamily pyrophosphatase or phosphodiesterase
MRYFSFYKDNSLVNLSNSILNRYNVKPFHKTNKKVDEILQNRCKTALFLFDGFGKSVSEKHLSEDSYLRKNKFDTISSTFPPTTVAATNAFKSVLYPAEHGWLGWTFLDKEKNRVVEYFTHRNYLTKEPVDDFDYSIFKYDSIFELIRRQNPGLTVYENYPCEISDGKNNGYSSMDEMFERASSILSNNDNALIYSYYLEPDHSLHDLGTSDRKIAEICREINNKIEEFALKHPDTLILVFADHSHIDVEPIFFEDLTELKNCVTNIYAIEARTASFVLKEGKEKEFLNYYKNHLSQHYDLLTKEKAINSQLFGLTNNNYWLEKLLGDYVLIAIGKHSFENFKLDPMKATHAGGTEEENLINLYVLNK